MSAKRFTAIGLVLGLMVAGGCSQCCYKVTDTCTNAVYYTHEVHRTPCGTYEFGDARTIGAWSCGDRVELQSARVERVPNCQCRSEDITQPPCGDMFPCAEKSLSCATGI